MPRPPETSDFKPVPLPQAQTTVARCTTMIDLGTVPETYMGEVKMQRKIWLSWELPKLLGVFNEDKGEQPFNIGLELTFSTDDRSNFSKLISNWRNKPLDEKEKKEFDPTGAINKVALISFIHVRKAKYKTTEIGPATSENTWLKFNGISQVPEGLTCPPMISERLAWDWDPIVEGKEKFDKEKFEKIPKFLRERMRSSEEFHKYAGGYDEAESANTTDAEEEKIETDNEGW